MNSHLVVILFAALAFGHSVVADDEPKPSFLKGVFSNIIDVITGGIKATPHVVGGEVAIPHSHPYQVFLLIKRKSDSYQCGGSLIAPQWVLTAAHCVEKTSSILVVLGSHNLKKRESSRQLIEARRAVIHPYWDDDFITNDIALLGLEKPATLNKYVQTIRLPSLRLKIYGPPPRTPVVLIGWGRYSDSNQEGSPVLRSVRTQLLPNRECSYLLQGPIPKTILCANGANGRGVCNGDSGGPMVVTESDGQRTVIGIASFVSESGCEKNYPSAFTRVDQYLPWIAKYTGIILRRG